MLHPQAYLLASGYRTCHEKRKVIGSHHGESPCLLLVEVKIIMSTINKRWNYFIYYHTPRHCIGVVGIGVADIQPPPVQHRHVFIVLVVAAAAARPPPTGDAREGRGRWVRQGGGGMVVAGGGGHCHYCHHHLRRHHLRSRLCHRQQCGGGGRWRRVFVDFVITAPVRPVGTISLTVLLEDSSNPPFHGFLGRVVDLVLYETKVLGLKPPPGGLSTNPQLTFVTFAPVSVHSPHISPY